MPSATASAETLDDDSAAGRKGATTSNRDMNINQDQQNLLVLGCMLSLHTMNLNMNINNITSGRQDNTRSIMGKKTATTRRRMRKWTTKHHLYYFQYLEQSQDNVFLGSPASLKRPPKRRSQRVLPWVPEIAKPPLQTRDILPPPRIPARSDTAPAAPATLATPVRRRRRRAPRPGS